MFSIAMLNRDLTETCEPKGSILIQNESGSKIVSLEQSEVSLENSDNIHGQILFGSNTGDLTKALFIDMNPGEAVVRGLTLTAGPYNNATYSLVFQSFYTNDTMSVLVSSTEGHRLIQVPVPPMEHYMSKVSLSPHSTTQLNMDGMVMKNLSVFSIAGPVSMII